MKRGSTIDRLRVYGEKKHGDKETGRTMGKRSSYSNKMRTKGDIGD